MQNAMSSWLEACVNMGRDLPMPTLSLAKRLNICREIPRPRRASPIKHEYIAGRLVLGTTAA